ncbi:MAG: hypothetical protein WDZ64_00985, partial [Parcubacteria group bacterium]
IAFEQKWNRKKLMQDDVEIYKDLYFDRLQKLVNPEEVISRADIIEEIPFQPLDHLLEAKIDTSRDKDLKDIELIKLHLAKQNCT